jgi:hypothetical protein
MDLDPGEKHLLAYVMDIKDAFFICSPDKACIKAAKKIGILDRMVTLEELFESAGISVTLKKQFTKVWHAQFRTSLL